MTKAANKTARYRVISDASGNRYRFFCEQSGMAMVTTASVHADTPEEALHLAWESEGRQHFNRCGKCGKWVSDVMFNPEAAECVVCAPWEDSCPCCGGAVPCDTFCRGCGAALRQVGSRDAP